jgi:GT2 family glycosyltransferase/ADP-heptose:LPS heptosyltransferase
MKLSILILNKDKPELIGPCLESIFKHVLFIDFEVLVGDTGSKDPLVIDIYNKFLESFSGKFKAIDIGKYHFSKNNNELAKRARGEQLLFLNNDTLIFSDAVQNMVRFLEEETSVGAVGPRLVFGHNHKIQHAGIEFFEHYKFGVLGYHPYAGRHSLMPDVNCPRKIVPAVTGACILMRASDFRSVQGFNEGYESEAQDVDLCLKISALGKKVVLDSKSTLVHLENGSRVVGEENSHDRKKLRNQWLGVIKCDYLNQQFQFRYFEDMEHEQFKKRKKILFVRARARGDVLASLRLCRSLKEKDPTCHLTFKTDFPDLVDASPYVDRVLDTGDFDNWQYDQTLSAVYEDGAWKNTNYKWIEQMAVSIGLPPQIEDLPMSILNSAYDTYTMKANVNELPVNYIVISTGAGWVEREWTPAHWENLCTKLAQIGIGVVQIGGETDYQVSSAILRLNKNIQTNYEIICRSQGAILLDSFSLHVAMLTTVPIVLLTCKTGGDTVWLTSNVREVRNVWATNTPRENCKTAGCRLRYGDGLDNPCSKAILWALDAGYVFKVVEEHILLRMDSHVRI